MFKKLKVIAENAYAPYSNFRVAAIYEMSDGKIYSGINIENAAYPASICAERVGLFSMINNGVDLKEVKAIHIFSLDSKEFLSPCGGCRQVLSEHIDLDVIFYLYKNDGEFILKKFNEIFPLPVQKENVRGN